MATYTLPTFNNQLGTFTVVVESTVTGLVTPTENTIEDLRGGNESLEVVPGTYSRDKGSLTVIDTNDAFWAQVVVGTCMVRVTLDEGSGATFAFAGDVDQVTTTGDELYNDGTNKRRRLTVILKSPLERLKDVTVVAVIQGIKDSGAEVAPVIADGYYTPVSAIFACAVDAAFSQAYVASDAYLQSGTSEEDWQWNDGASDLDFDQIYFQTQDVSDYVGYMLGSTDDYWADNYNNAWELIESLCNNFGLIPRYDYDVSGSRHRMQLLQRGRCFTDTVSLETPISSSFVFDSYMILSYLSAYLYNNTSLGWYYQAGTFFAAPAPDWFEPHLTIPCSFVVGYDISTYPTVAYQRLWSMATGEPVQIDTVKVWNYSTGVQDTFSTGAARMEKALLTYLAKRYRGSGQVTYKRKYPLLRASGGSQTAVQPMCEVSVDSVDCTAIECDKDWTTGEVTLTLVKI